VRIHDISPLVSERIGVWPGDVPLTRQTVQSMAAGDNLDLSAIHTTVHLGAHADAPCHYRAGGAAIHERPLDLFLGPCQVFRVELPRHTRIRPEHLDGPLRAPRVLLRTGTFPDPEDFNTDFAALSVELVEFLAAGGVRLVGIDTPSVDLFEDRALEAHKALGRFDMANLEGLVLEGVDPGLYTLVALPLKLEGADASPVRAVLLEEPAS